MIDQLKSIQKHKIERNIMKIGKAKYGAKSQKKYFKLKDGENTFRILPPLGDLADKGIWSVFYKVHYGYKNTKGHLRVFQSSLSVNRKTKMVEVPDAADQRIKELKAKLEEAKNTNNKPMVEKLSKLVSGLKPIFNLDSNHYMNVIDSQGNVGVLKIRHRAKTALDEKIKQLREKGVDPLSVDNGRYFVFRRSGMGLDTTFSVEVLQEKLKIEGVGEVNRDVIHKLDEELISRLGDEAAELDKLFRKLSAEEIERVVKASDLMTGVSPVLDELFDNRTDSSTEENYEDEDEAEMTSNQMEMDQAPVTQNRVVAKVQESIKSTPKVETMSSPVQTTAESVNEMTDEDFLKSLGI